MGGGLMQLVAYGAQDIYLTGNPQITFFKVVYRRHTNFSMEAIEQTMNGNQNTSGKSTVTVSRNGDLVGRVYLQAVSSGAPQTGVDNEGYNMLDYVEVEIGGQRIDKQFGHWMEVWAELTEPNNDGHEGEVSVDLGDAFGPNAHDSNNKSSGTRFQRMAAAGGVAAGTLTPGTYHVPLPFWFCRNPGLALPLIALQYHEVKLNIAFSSVNTPPTLPFHAGLTTSTLIPKKDADSLRYHMNTLLNRFSTSQKAPLDQWIFTSTIQLRN